MKRDYFIGILLMLSGLLVSCQKEPDYLEQALQFAGKNRPELEKVLQHYASDSKDSLKYKAAVFLIANMPGHCSYKNAKQMEAYHDEIDSVISLCKYREDVKIQMEKISPQYKFYSHDIVFDIHIMTADYLIDNIERSFAVWEQGDWATHVSFDDFCEYILPYKGDELQTLDNWREYSKEMFKGDLDTMHLCSMYENSAYQASFVVCQALIDSCKFEYPAGGIQAVPVKRISSLSKFPTGTCADYSLLISAAMRSKGIPVREDYTPQWAAQASSHSWNVVLVNNGKHMVFLAGSSRPGEVHKPHEKMVKILRKQYAINKESLNLLSSGNQIPHTLKSCFLEDVTDEYMATQDIEIKIPAKFKGKYQYAYLAVFDNKTWVPVHYGKVVNNKVVFDKMGRDCMYLPVFYDQNGIVPISSPFLITAKGEIKPHTIDKDNLQTMTLYRKYFIGTHCYNVAGRLYGGKFQASNYADFRDSITIFQIPYYVVQSGEFELNHIKEKYRYWRYVSADEGYNNMAELYFYKAGDIQPVYGKIIGTSGNYTSKDSYPKEVVFDGNPLTHYDALTPSNSWVGMDFGEPVSIERISYTPRGDGNDITPGDIHEFLYWDETGWVSLGTQKAYNIKLVYENIPKNTVYWVRNLSRGNEERIFTYENEKQIWW